MPSILKKIKLPSKISLNQLNKRERYVVLGAACLIGLFVLVQFVIVPLFENKAQLQKTLKGKMITIQKMQELQAEYGNLKAGAKQSEARFARREKGFTVFAFLDRLAGNAGIKDRVSYMKPSKKAQKNSRFKLSLVEMKLDGITLEQLTAYLHGVETSKNMVNIKKISISKKDKKQGLLTAVLQVETIEI